MVNSPSALNMKTRKVFRLVSLAGAVVLAALLPRMQKRAPSAKRAIGSAEVPEIVSSPT